VGRFLDFTTSPTLGALLAMLNPYLSLFQKAVEFVVIIVERVKVVLPIELNQNSLFVVGVGAIVNDTTHNVRLYSIMRAKKHNNIARSQITNLTLNSHT